MPNIQVTSGKFSEDTCLVSNNLTINQLKQPEISDILYHVEGRQISHLIVQGFTGKEDLGKIVSKLPQIPKSQLIGDNAFRYRVQGRIQKASPIVEQIGSSNSDGTYQLRMKDNYIYPTMVIVHNGNKLQSRCMAPPIKSGSTYIMDFKTLDGTVFNWTTHVAGQAGEKTLFPLYTLNSAKSLRGYSRVAAPDMYIGHLSIQRKAVALDGDLLTDITWVTFNGGSGWRFEIESQIKRQMVIEDEVHKWFGVSTMKDSDGSLRDKSRIIDDETGMDVIAGDSIYELLRGTNEGYGSGTDGVQTRDDIVDMLTTLSGKSNAMEGKRYYIVTGTDGWNTLQSIFGTEAQKFGISFIQPSSTEIGGPKVPVGYNFDTLNINGDQVIAVRHPMFDDKDRWTEKGSDGRNLRSSLMLFMDMTPTMGKPNIEIMAKGQFGINRSLVEGYINGITGLSQYPMVNSVDALQLEYLKQDGIFMYITNTSGMMHKAA